MKAVKTIAAATGFALLTSAGSIANAAPLEITVDNQTKSEVVMAFSYLSNKEQDWVVDGWYNIEPNKTANIDLDTDNDIYYLYAEFSNGKKIEGGQGAVELSVQDTSFLYKQKDEPENSRKVSFLRARSNGSKATIKVK